MSSNRICRALAVLGAVGLGCLTGGCTEDDPCDDGEILVDGWCNLATPDAAIPQPTSDAAAVNPGGDEAGGAATAFGQACMTNTECPPPTDYCAFAPGQASGNCTATGCNLDPTKCPAGWPCMDLTAIPMVGQHLCVPPGTPGT